MNICFFLDHPRIMHLGDQLFFKPLFGQLRAANFSVSVIVSKKVHNCYTNFKMYNTTFRHTFQNKCVAPCLKQKC